MRVGSGALFPLLVLLAGCRGGTEPSAPAPTGELAQAATASPRSATARAIQVRVDPRVELLCILARLAGFEEYDRPLDYTYASDAAAWFGPFADHPAIRTLQLARLTNGISYDAVINMAVHLGDPPALEEQGSWEGAERSLDERWRTRTARRFAEQARDFVRVSDFEGFLAANAALYAETEARLEALLAGNDVLPWFETFFGIPAGARFFAIPGLLTGGASYGGTARAPEGKRIYQVLGVWNADEDGLPVFEDSVLSTVVHEFCHAFANPLVDAFAEELEQPCRYLYPFVEEDMQLQAYGSWRTMMYESLVRACTAQFEPPGPAREAVLTYETLQRGFLWTRELSQALDRYEARRERWPTLASFMPELVLVMEDWAERADELFGRRDERLRAWHEATPSLSPELELEVQHGLSEALIRVERALAAPDDDSGRSRRERFAESLHRMRFERDVQVTVLDARGDFVFHVQDLLGSAYGHRDVHGQPVYRRLNESEANQGLARNFDFVSQDGARGRANVIAWTRLTDPPLLICVEGHEWRKRDALGH